MDVDEFWNHVDKILNSEPRKVFSSLKAIEEEAHGLGIDLMHMPICELAEEIKKRRGKK